MFAAFNRTQSAQFGGSGTSHVIACWLLPFLRTRDRAFKPLNERLQLNAATARLQVPWILKKLELKLVFLVQFQLAGRAGAFTFAGKNGYQRTLRQT